MHHIRLVYRPHLNPRPPPVGDDPHNARDGAAQSETGPVPLPGGFPDGDDATGSNDSTEPYQPSVLDVLVAKAMLHKALSLPIELVDRIVDFAEYWPHTSAVLDYGRCRAVAQGDSSSQDKFLLRTLPLGFAKPVHPDAERYKTQPAKALRLSAEQPIEQFHRWIGSPSTAVQHPCRKIVFTIASKDQGWGGEEVHHNTYGGSWTWFEAGLERIDASGECGDNCPDHSGRRPEHAQQSGASSDAARPHISPCALRPVVPAVLGERHERTQLHHPLFPSAEYKIQCNKTACDCEITYRIEWRADDHIDPESAEAGKLEEAGRGRATGTGEFVRNLKLGDVVTVWAKARFPLWSNKLRFLQVDVYWAV